MILGTVIALFIFIDSGITETIPKFTLDFERCPNIPFPLEVRIKNCAKQPCEFEMGEDFVAEAVFRPDGKLTKTNSVTKVKLGNTWVNFNLKKVGGEAYLEDTPRSIPARTEKFILKMPIKKTYPKVGITIEHNLKNQLGRNVFCYRIQAKPKGT